MQRIKSAITKNLLVYVYVIFFIAFASVALWDVKEIVVNYIDDNRFTSVKARNSLDDGYPFLEQPMICLTYDRPIIPGVNWIEFTSILNDSLHQRDIVWPENMSKSKKSMNKKIINIIKYTVIKTKDEDTHSANDLANILHLTTDTLFDLVDSFMKNSATVNAIKNALSDDELKKNFVKKYQTTPNEIILDSIRYHSEGNDQLRLRVCIKPPLADDIKSMNRNEKIGYGLNLNVLPLDNDTQIDTVSIAESVRFYLLNAFHKFERASHSSTTQIRFDIGTSELRDSQRFPPCTLNYKTEIDCKNDLKRTIMASVCECEQFSKIIKTKNVFSVNTSRSICTMRIYERCWKKYTKEYRRQNEINNARQSCKPCLTATNSFSKAIDVISYTRSKIDDWYPFYELTFHFNTGTYLLYEEKPQFNFSQLVSQIGGSLGLYIGFSMMSVLQLILFLYQTRSKIDSRSNSRKWRDWFRFFGQFVVKDLKNVDDKNVTNYRELKGQILEMQLEMRELKREIEQLKTSGQRKRQKRFSALLCKPEIQDDKSGRDSSC